MMQNMKNLEKLLVALLGHADAQVRSVGPPMTDAATRGGQCGEGRC